MIDSLAAALTRLVIVEATSPWVWVATWSRGGDAGEQGSQNDEEGFADEHFGLVVEKG